MIGHGRYSIYELYFSEKLFNFSLMFNSVARKCSTWGDLSHRLAVRLGAFIFLLGITSDSRYLKNGSLTRSSIFIIY